MNLSSSEECLIEMPNPSIKVNRGRTKGERNVGKEEIYDGSSIRRCSKALHARITQTWQRL